jgi:Fe2+ transport system protein FeoA
VTGTDQVQEGVRAARDYARRVRELGIDPDEAVRLAREALA